MTYEKWMEEMTKKMVMEMCFSSTDEPVMFPAREHVRELIDEDEEEMCARG